MDKYSGLRNEVVCQDNMKGRRRRRARGMQRGLYEINRNDRPGAMGKVK